MVEIFAFLGCYPAQTGRHRRFWTTYRFITSYQSTPPNNAEEQIPRLHGGGSLKSRTVLGDGRGGWSTRNTLVLFITVKMKRSATEMKKKSATEMKKKSATETKKVSRDGNRVTAFITAERETPYLYVFYNWRTGHADE